MGILMAAGTFHGHPKERLVKIFYLDVELGGSLNPLGIMAIFARQGLMFSHQREICKRFMLESGPVKFRDLELAAVVF